jgi:HD-GYP domain-containing protein (c-di-GMP phosphodiesterase class II)
MRVLFANDNDKERQIYAVYIDNILTDVEVVEAFSSDQAINHIEKNPKFDLILASSSMIDGPGPNLYAYIREQMLSVPFVLFSSDLPETLKGLEGFRSHNPHNSNILLPLSPAQFKENILKILKPSRFTAEAVAAFQKVKLMHFWRFNKVLCNIYIRLSDHKYVKIIKENETYTKNELKRLHDKGFEYLYIRNDDFEKFNVGFLKTPFLIMTTEKMTPDEISDALSMTHTMMQNLIVNLGFTREVIELAEKSIREILNLIKREEAVDLNNIFQKMRQDNNYIYDHSYLLCIVCCDILKHMRWNTTEEIIKLCWQKLCMASLFHDITVTNPDLAVIEQASDERLKLFSHEEVTRYLGHPNEIGELLKKNDYIPQEVEVIVRQHHENIEGTGFPSKLHHLRLNQLSCIFIIAHDYVSNLYKIEFDQNSAKHNELITRLSDKYSIGNFKGPIESFCKAHQNIISSAAASASADGPANNKLN